MLKPSRINRYQRTKRCANSRFKPLITVVSTDEKGLAAAIMSKCSYEMDKVLAVFKELDWAYSSDADDVAVEYVRLLQSAPLQVRLAFKGHARLRNLLVSIMESGWTSGKEKRAISYIQYL